MYFTKEEILKGVFTFILNLLTCYGYKRVCYYTNWSQYRKGIARFVPENIDVNICTHLIYAFAKLEGNQLAPVEWNDDTTPWSKGMYERFNNLKIENPSLKTLLAVGGWNFGSKPFSDMALLKSTRSEFVNSTIKFLRTRNFDGLDIDWEYPGRRGGPPQDKVNLALLMKELRHAFDEESTLSGKSRLLLSIAVPADEEKINDGYDVPVVSKYADFINVMSYDLHGAWDPATGHNSPLYPKSKDTGYGAQKNVKWVADYWLKLGTPRSKIIIGFPMFGRGFTLRDKTVNGVGAAVSGGSHAGPHTTEMGYIAYFEVCKMIADGAKVYRDTEQKVPYLVKDDQWIGYDDVDSYTEKANWVKQNKFGGVMVWSLALDDFTGTACKTGSKFPMTKALMRLLTMPDESSSTNIESDLIITDHSSQLSEGTDSGIDSSKITIITSDISSTGTGKAVSVGSVSSSDSTQSEMSRVQTIRTTNTAEVPLELDVTKSGEQIKLENTALADIKSIDGAQMEVSESSISSGIDSQAKLSESSSMPIGIDTSSRSVGDTSVLATGVEKEIIFKSTSTTIFTSAQDDVDKSVGVVTPVQSNSQTQSSQSSITSVSTGSVQTDRDTTASETKIQSESSMNSISSDVSTDTTGSSSVVDASTIINTGIETTGGSSVVDADTISNTRTETTGDSSVVDAGTIINTGAETTRGSSVVDVSTIINTGTETTGGSSVVDAGTMINTGTETTVTKAFTPSISTHTSSETSSDKSSSKVVSSKTSVVTGSTSETVGDVSHVATVPIDTSSRSEIVKTTMTKIMGDNSVKDTGISDGVTQTEVSKTSIADVVSETNKESVVASGLTKNVARVATVPIVSEASVVTGSTSESVGDVSHVATVPIVSEASIVTGSTSERVGDVSHVATVPIDTGSGRDIVETTITKTVTMTNSNSPSGIIDTGTSISTGSNLQTSGVRSNINTASVNIGTEKENKKSSVTVTSPESSSMRIEKKTILATGPIVTSARTDDSNSITIEKKTSKLQTGKDNSASIDTGIATGISQSTSTVISSGSQIMGDNSMNDVGISDVVTQTDVSKTSIGDVVSGANEESVDTSVVSSGLTKNVASSADISETSVVTGSTSETIGDLSHVANIPIDISSGREIVETTMTKTVTISNSNSPSGIIDTGTSISTGSNLQTSGVRSSIHTASVNIGTEKENKKSSVTVTSPESSSMKIEKKTILATGPIVTSARTDDANAITIEKKTSKLQTGKDNSASIDTGIPTSISQSTSTVISSGSQTMGDNSMKDVGIGDVVTQTEVSKTSIGDVVSGTNEESVDTSVVSSGLTKNVASSADISETSVVTGSTSETVEDLSHVANIPIDTSSGREIVETTMTKTVTISNSNSPSGIIDTGTSISTGSNIQTSSVTSGINTASVNIGTEKENKKFSVTVTSPESSSMKIEKKPILATGPIVTSARTDDSNSITIEKKTSKLQTGKDNSASIDTRIPTSISQSTSTVISSGSKIMGDNSMKDVGIGDVVTQTEVSKTSIGDVVSGANEESVDTSVVSSGLTKNVASSADISETSVVTGGTSETVGDLPIDTSSGREIVETTMTKTVTISNSNSPSGIIDTGTSISTGSNIQTSSVTSDINAASVNIGTEEENKKSSMNVISPESSSRRIEEKTVLATGPIETSPRIDDSKLITIETKTTTLQTGKDNSAAIDTGMPTGISKSTSTVISSGSQTMGDNSVKDVGISDSVSQTEVSKTSLADVVAGAKEESISSSGLTKHVANSVDIAETSVVTGSTSEPVGDVSHVATVPIHTGSGREIVKTTITKTVTETNSNSPSSIIESSSNIDASGIIDTSGNIDRGTSISSGSNLQAIGGDSSVAVDTIHKSAQDQLAMTSSTSTTVTDTGSHAIPDSPVLVDSRATNVPSESIEMSKTTIVSATGAENSNLKTDSKDVDIKKKIEKASLNINLEAGRNTKTITDKRTEISDSVVTNSNAKMIESEKTPIITIVNTNGDSIDTHSTVMKSSIVTEHSTSKVTGQSAGTSGLTNKESAAGSVDASIITNTSKTEFNTLKDGNVNNVGTIAMINEQPFDVVETIITTVITEVKPTKSTSSVVQNTKGSDRESSKLLTGTNTQMGTDVKIETISQSDIDDSCKTFVSSQSNIQKHEVTDISRTTDGHSKSKLETRLSESSERPNSNSKMSIVKTVETDEPAIISKQQEVKTTASFQASLENRNLDAQQREVSKSSLSTDIPREKVLDIGSTSAVGSEKQTKVIEKTVTTVVKGSGSEVASGDSSFVTGTGITTSRDISDTSNTETKTDVVTQNVEKGSAWDSLLKNSSNIDSQTSISKQSGVDTLGAGFKENNTILKTVQISINATEDSRKGNLKLNKLRVPVIQISKPQTRESTSTKIIRKSKLKKGIRAQPKRTTPRLKSKTIVRQPNSLVSNRQAISRQKASKLPLKIMKNTHQSPPMEIQREVKTVTITRETIVPQKNTVTIKRLSKPLTATRKVKTRKITRPSKHISTIHTVKPNKMKSITNVRQSKPIVATRQLKKISSVRRNKPIITTRLVKTNKTPIITTRLVKTSKTPITTKRLVKTIKKPIATSRLVKTTSITRQTKPIIRSSQLKAVSNARLEKPIVSTSQLRTRTKTRAKTGQVNTISTTRQEIPKPTARLVKTATITQQAKPVSSTRQMNTVTNTRLMKPVASTAQTRTTTITRESNPILNTGQSETISTRQNRPKSKATARLVKTATITQQTNQIPSPRQVNTVTNTRLVKPVAKATETKTIITTRKSKQSANTRPLKAISTPRQAIPQSNTRLVKTATITQQAKPIPSSRQVNTVINTRLVKPVARTSRTKTITTTRQSKQSANTRPLKAISTTRQAIPQSNTRLVKTATITQQAKPIPSSRQMNTVINTRLVKPVARTSQTKTITTTRQSKQSGNTRPLKAISTTRQATPQSSTRLVKTTTTTRQTKPLIRSSLLKTLTNARIKKPTVNNSQIRTITTTRENTGQLKTMSTTQQNRPKSMARRVETATITQRSKPIPSARQVNTVTNTRLVKPIERRTKTKTITTTRQFKQSGNTGPLKAISTTRQAIPQSNTRLLKPAARASQTKTITTTRQSKQMGNTISTTRRKRPITRRLVKTTTRTLQTKPVIRTLQVNAVPNTRLKTPVSSTLKIKTTNTRQLDPITSTRLVKTGTSRKTKPLTKPSGAITMIGKTSQQNTKPKISMSQSKSSTATIGQKLPLSNARKSASISRTTSRKSKPVISTRENTERIKRSHDNFDYNAHFRTRSLLQTADTGNQEIRSSGFSSVLSSLLDIVSKFATGNRRRNTQRSSEPTGRGRAEARRRPTVTARPTVSPSIVQQRLLQRFRARERQRNINRAVQQAASPSRNTSQTVSRVQIQSGISTQSRSRSQNRVSNQRGRDIEPIVSPDVRRQSALSPTRPNQGNRLRERIRATASGSQAASTQAGRITRQRVRGLTNEPVMAPVSRDGRQRNIAETNELTSLQTGRLRGNARSVIQNSLQNGQITGQLRDSFINQVRSTRGNRQHNSIENNRLQSSLRQSQTRNTNNQNGSGTRRILRRPVSSTIDRQRVLRGRLGVSSSVQQLNTDNRAGNANEILKRRLPQLGIELDVTDLSRSTNRSMIQLTKPPVAVSTEQKMNRRIPERNLAVEPNVAAQRILQNDLLDRRRVLMQQNQIAMDTVPDLRNNAQNRISNLQLQSDARSNGNGFVSEPQIFPSLIDNNVLSSNQLNILTERRQLRQDNNNAPGNSFSLFPRNNLRLNSLQSLPNVLLQTRNNRITTSIENNSNNDRTNSLRFDDLSLSPGIAGRNTNSLLSQIQSFRSQTRPASLPLPIQNGQRNSPMTSPLLIVSNPPTTPPKTNKIKTNATTNVVSKPTSPQNSIATLLKTRYPQLLPSQISALSNEIQRQVQEVVQTKLTEQLLSDVTKTKQIIQKNTKPEQQSNQNAVTKQTTTPIVQRKVAKAQIKQSTPPNVQRKVVKAQIKQSTTPIVQRKVVKAQIKQSTTPIVQRKVVKAQIKQSTTPIVQRKVVKAQIKSTSNPTTQERQRNSSTSKIQGLQMLSGQVDKGRTKPAGSTISLEHLRRELIRSGMPSNLVIQINPVPVIAQRGRQTLNSQIPTHGRLGIVPTPQIPTEPRLLSVPQIPIVSRLRSTSNTNILRINKNLRKRKRPRVPLPPLTTVSPVMSKMEAIQTPHELIRSEKGNAAEELAILPSTPSTSPRQQLRPSNRTVILRSQLKQDVPLPKSEVLWKWQI